jgi:hypothetical protein
MQGESEKQLGLLSEINLEARVRRSLVAADQAMGRSCDGRVVAGVPRHVKRHRTALDTTGTVA